MPPLRYFGEACLDLCRFLTGLKEGKSDIRYKYKLKVAFTNNNQKI